MGMERNRFPQTTENRHRLYCSNILTLIVTTPTEEKRLFHSAISILIYRSMKTSLLHPRQDQNQRRIKQKSFLKQSLALKSRLPNRLKMSILLPTQSQSQTQIQTQIEKTETLTRIQILKLEILGMDLGPVVLDIRSLETEHSLMNRKISKVLLLLRRLAVKPSRVLNSVLLQ